MKNYKSHSSSFSTFSANYCRRFGVIVFLLFFNFHSIQARDYNKEITLDPIKSYDEVPVEILVKGYLKFEADVIITDRNLVYINVEELFKKLGIQCIAENNGDLLKGFIVNENTPYTIDFNLKQIDKGDKSIKSVNGIVKELGAIYVETSVMNEVFGLNMVFNFRALSIKLDAEFELPLVKQARLEAMRQNISKLQSKNEMIIDTIVGRKYHLFNGGTLDWTVNSFQTIGDVTNNRFLLGLGSELLYGEATVSFNYFDQTKFDRRQLLYSWRWINNENNYVKQIQIGRVGVQSVAFIRGPVVGASISNSPNTVRKAKGTYTINDYTEPNWTVELYINDALVDYTQADASGLYIFNVPVVYGYTKLKLRFYGPLGEERIEEKIMNTPYTFMPTNVMEYNVSGGIVDDGNSSRFSRGEVNYGINRFVTIGGGVEYLESIVDSPVIPFANLAFQPFTKMIVNLKYAHDVSFKGLLNYYFGKSAFLELDYTNFAAGQKALINITKEERKINLTVPYKLNVISGNARLSLNQFVYNTFNFNQLEAVFSGRYKNYSANATLASNWIDGLNPFTTTTIAVSRKLRNGLILRPTLQYNNSENRIIRVRAEIEKRIVNMSYSASYERSFQFANDNLFLNFRYDLSFARTGLSAAYNNKRYTVSQNAQGSMAFGADNGVIVTGNNSALSRGGILFYPFIDLNQNGKLDKGEKRVLLSKVKVLGGKAVISEKDSIVRVSDLNAFINYNVEFSDSDLDNISWRFKHKNYQVLIDPNQYKKVDVPIIVLGEINGTVSIVKEGVTNGQGRITVQIYDYKGQKVTETQSESDGYFSYLGLKQGEYTIRIDDAQLKKLGYHSTPKSYSKSIQVSIDGAIVQNLDFILGNSEAKVLEVVAPDESQNNSVPIKSELIKKDSKKASETNKSQQGVKKSGNGTLNILNRYSKETNGKIYGKVFSKSALASKAVKDVVVELYSIKGEKLAQASTNESGEYSFVNLKPLEYEFRLNDAQLENLGYQTLTKSKKAVIITAVEGDIIENQNFEIIEKENFDKKTIIQNNTTNAIPLENSVEKKSEHKEENNTSDAIIEKKKAIEARIKKSFSSISDEKGSFYSIQIGVFKNIVTPKQLLNLAPVYYDILNNETTRYLSGKYDLLKTAKVAKNKIVSNGIKDAYVVAYQDGGKIDRINLDILKRNPIVKNKTISGQVQVKEANSVKGIKGLSVEIWNKEEVKIAEVITNNKGIFIFNGITTGSYTIRLNEGQLKKLKYQSTPKIHYKVISASAEEDQIPGLDFLLN